MSTFIVIKKCCIRKILLTIFLFKLNEHFIRLNGTSQGPGLLAKKKNNQLSISCKYQNIF